MVDPKTHLAERVDAYRARLTELERIASNEMAKSLPQRDHHVLLLVYRERYRHAGVLEELETLLRTWRSDEG